MDSEEFEQKKKEKEIYIQRKKPSINDVMFVSIISFSELENRTFRTWKQDFQKGKKKDRNVI